jgi:hypothetical protein
MQSTKVPEKVPRLESIGVKWDSFEEKFFPRAYYSGEFQLDPVLYSLLHLDETMELIELSEHKQILFDKNRLRLKMREADRGLKEKFKSVSKRKDFNPLRFVIENDIPLDKISGVYPMVFNNYRLVSHSLRMAWAFYLTLKMKKMERISYNQRFRKGDMKSTPKNLFTTLFVHIWTHLSQLENSEKKWIKCLKNSLCRHVSIAMDQEELPEGDHFNMVPIQLRNFFRGLEKRTRINFFFSLLQSKSLCKEVPEDFILDTLISHREQLSKESEPLSEATRRVLFNRGKEFGKRVVKYYRYSEGYLPSNKATFAFPRDMGGQKADLVHSDRLTNRRQRPNDRMEPLVIGLFGQPGQGKSTQINLILSKLKKLFPECPRDKLTYSRSCHTEHWDGYCNQPIVILDDIGQSKEGKDIKEFQTLVSCNPYIPPMASLEDKGISFDSPIIILTSNLFYGMRLNCHYTCANGIIDDASFWRRIHIPLHVELGELNCLREKPNWVRESNLITRKGIFRKVGQSRSLDSHQFFQNRPVFNRPDETGQSFEQDLWITVNETFLDDIVKTYRYRERHHDNIRRSWTQIVHSRTENPVDLISSEFYKEQIEPYLPSSLGFDGSPELVSELNALEFDAFPPEGPLPVRVEPIVEPLKVRTITAGIGDTFCLKPFQRAMWHALGEEEQFCLTHGTNNLEPAISRIWEQNPSNEVVWISGDYTAATDSFPIEATKCLLEGILESIEHEPTKRWAMKEISPHLLVYPEKFGIEPVLQKSGQLMGSLLSFPLLCLLNDCTARSIGLSPKEYLINGDDILMRTKPSNYPIWKEKVREFGLSLSLGKNYVHPEFGTINSQLIFREEVLDAGKQKVFDRRSHVLGECLRDLEVMMKYTAGTEVQELFKTINRSKLSRTVRSIRVPVSHGGLAFSWGERINISDRDKRTELLVYLHDLFCKISPEKDCIAIPYLSLSQYKNETIKNQENSFNEPVPVTEYHEDFLGIPDLERVRKRIHTNSNLRTLFFGQEIEDLPSLSFLRVLQIPFKDKKVKKEIQMEVDRVFFQNFLNPNTDYTYELFQKTFLHAVRGVPNTATEVATQYLAPIIDLQVRPDYLLQVSTSYKSKSFDSQLFEKSIGKNLKPKQFNLPYISDSPDFSREVEESFDFLREQILKESDVLDQIDLQDIPGYPHFVHKGVPILGNSWPKGISGLEVAEAVSSFL